MELMQLELKRMAKVYLNQNSPVNIPGIFDLSLIDN